MAVTQVRFLVGVLSARDTPSSYRCAHDCLTVSFWSYNLVVECLSRKQETRVRFLLRPFCSFLGEVARDVGSIPISYMLVVSLGRLHVMSVRFR